ncbi:uncharacterized protein TM35_000291760 [Trypanosoma theileri]|uniref:Cilia- and flagella-associated protein 263 n=1 Tax=Trypanosoma theileri TaxID=67003 RepID=A0A1X0NNL2_9TRYP|nr:uncharacterized protein TM35_000291760 [Trypanosoma theileri]ORC86294.1 hypothetical protein TM35_000291760 [Trypanosoma theileri]
MSIQYLDLEGGANNNSANPFDFLAPENNEQQLWAEVYIKQFPDASEFEEMTPEEQREIVAELRDEVELLEEEANVMVHQAENLRIPRTQGLGGGGLNNNNNNTTTAAAAIPSSTSTRKSVSAFLPSENPAAATDESTASESAIAVSSESAAPSLPNSVRRGQAYSRKSVDTGDLYVTLEDRVTLLMRERDRMRQQRERDEREGDHLRELLKATVEEAVSRTQELRLDILQFNREVLNEGSDTASSDDLLRYMERRFNAQRKYLDKLNAQSAAAERSILQSQQHLRQRHAAGEAFHAIDFEQLRIENQQFTERIERKNLELVELKGTSTRTVQTLNTLMDTLNALTAEQNRLRKDYKSRCEYLARLQREVDAVAHEADIAERKNAVIKAQHEAVRVPKIEHYVAQKAEEYELRRAERNWKRKVEIAEGQLELTQQQIRVLARATDSTRGRGKRMPRRRITNTTGSSYTNRSSQISTVTAVYTDAGAEPEKSSPSGPPSIEAEKALLGLKKSQSM